MENLLCWFFKRMEKSIRIAGPFSFCSDLWILILAGMDSKKMDPETGGGDGNVAQNNHR
jgi:hypothetical protein